MAKFDYASNNGFANKYFAKADELNSEYNRIREKNDFGAYDEMLNNIGEEITELNKLGFAEMANAEAESEVKTLVQIFADETESETIAINFEQIESESANIGKFQTQ